MLKVLRDKVFRLAHEGHQGVVKTKYRLRSKVWWPGMDKDVEKLCKVCYCCQVTSSYDPPDQMFRVLPPSALLVLKRCLFYLFPTNFLLIIFSHYSSQIRDLK